MKAGKAADHFEVAELFGPDIHEKVFAIGVFAIEALDGVLHRRGELAVGSPKLLKKHVARMRDRVRPPEQCT